MKITILVGLFPPRWIAGTEMATYNIARHLALRGHHIDVITSLDAGLSRRGLEQGFTVHRIGLPRGRVMGTIVFWLKAILRIRRLNPDIIHGQSTAMGLICFLAKQLLRRPYVVYLRGSDVHRPWSLKKVISKLVLNNADAVVALTEQMRRETLELCSRDVDVIPNGVDAENYEALPQKSTVRERLGLRDDRRIILFVGTLRPIKGTRYLIEAMHTIRRRDAESRLLIVGDGEERPSLEQLVLELNLGDTVTFAGKVPNDRVPEYMAAADIFALASLSEGFPLVVAEAMAAGLPIVASRVGSLPEIVEEGENGFLVEPAEPQEIADRILMLLADRDLRRKIGEANRWKAKSYSWHHVAEQLDALYRSMISGEDDNEARS